MEKMQNSSEEIYKLLNDIRKELKEDIKEIRNDIKDIKNDFNDRFSKIDEKIEDINERLDGLSKEIVIIGEKESWYRKYISDHIDDYEKLQKKVDILDKDVNGMKNAFKVGLGIFSIIGTIIMTFVGKGYFDLTNFFKTHP